MSSATAYVTWTRVVAGLYHGVSSATNAKFTIWRSEGLWFVYSGHLSAEQANVTQHVDFESKLADAKAAIERAEAASVPDERFEVGRLVWDANTELFARVAKVSARGADVVFVTYPPGHGLPGDSFWAFKGNLVPQTEPADSPAPQPNAHQGDVYGAVEIFVGVRREPLPGVIVKAVQAIGRTVTYTAHGSHGTAGHAWLRTLPASATVTRDEFGWSAVWSVTYAYQVREVRPVSESVAA